MSRPRTPSNVLDARGAFKKNPNRARPDEPSSEGEIGDPPERFTEDQRAAWGDFARTCHAGVLGGADRIALEIAAVLLADFRVNPADFPAAKLARLDSLLGRFGMTPSDRSKVKAPKKEAANAFKKLVKKRGAA
jgi:hypothetical protein